MKVLYSVYFSKHENEIHNPVMLMAAEQDFWRVSKWKVNIIIISRNRSTLLSFAKRKERITTLFVFKCGYDSLSE